jgi:hypothetical protein
MRHALAGALRRYRAAVLIGSDCPALTPRDLRRTAQLLKGACDVVIAPAEDGGYAMVGARTAPARMFSGIAWGGESVYRETVKRMTALRLRWRESRTVWDVDRPEDLDRLAALQLSG